MYNNNEIKIGWQTFQNIGEGNEKGGFVKDGRIKYPVSEFIRLELIEG